jgi:hypothetical protein
LIDITARLKSCPITIHYKNLPDGGSAKYIPRRGSRPPSLTLPKETANNSMDFAFLSAMAIKYHELFGLSKQARPFTFYIDRDPTDEHMQIRREASKLLLDKQEVMKAMNIVGMDFESLQERLGCNAAILDCRLSCRDIE